MHSFEVHSNESACRKSGRLGLEQVIRQYYNYNSMFNLELTIFNLRVLPMNY